MNQPPPSFKRIKTGKIERRFSLAKAGLFAGVKLAGHSAVNRFFGNKACRETRKKEILSEQAHYFVAELGKLKGSVVKVGQMMALWGEHFLPLEVTEALHELEDNTAALAWPTMKQILTEQLGEARLAELDIEQTPIGSASLGQVHRAKVHSSGETICLKIQYPGVADAIDSDLDTLEQLLRLSRLVPITQEFKLWLEEIRSMMKREVNYLLERETTDRFRIRLENDPRFIVPKTYPRYSTARVLSTSYETGISIGSSECLQLSQARRNHIGAACLDLCWQEVFEWGEMQTDPNFGNYFIRLGHTAAHSDEHPADKIVLIDFGAVRRFPTHILEPGKELVRGAYHHDLQRIKKAMLHLGFVPQGTPDSVFSSFAELCFLAIEPFVSPSEAWPASKYYNAATGAYHWGDSNLASRAVAQAAKSAVSRFFSIPPKEFMFLSRKIIGAYTLMAVLDAHINGESILAPHLER